MSDRLKNKDCYSSVYPEQKHEQDNWLERFGTALLGPISRKLMMRQKIVDNFVSLVSSHQEKFIDATDEELSVRRDDLRNRLRISGIDDLQASAETFALVREYSHRVMGMRHYDVQVIGGFILLRGMVAEMQTGEGKTLTATLPACTAALAGLPVHVITVNDYLVERDAEIMKPLYEALGLTVGVVIQSMSVEERQVQYACDITYCTNNEVVFDYLKDRIALGNQRSRMRLMLDKLYGKEAKMHKLILRGLHFAIVDEADSVFIDEARTPLVISGAGRDGEENQIYKEALQIATELEKGYDYIIEERDHQIRLTDKGKDNIEELSIPYGGLWSGTQRREELIRQALQATFLFIRDKHYLVRDDKIVIIDEFTGRVMPDRAWELGLHQMIETKEDCEITGKRETLAKISYQKYFRRYLRLSGMTGTAKEVTSELWNVYRLNVFKIPTNLPVQRKCIARNICETTEEKWQRVADRILELNEQGRAILVGTSSVTSSEQLSQVLKDKNIEHNVLNAQQDEDEAEIVKQAGQAGQVTVATNMAGRGTDIKLGEGVSESGGLHVILTELHEARRIDRQLYGRSGRQGDNGSYEVIMSLEDEIFLTHANRFFKKTNDFLIKYDNNLSRDLALRVLTLVQISLERLHARVRSTLYKQDEKMESALAFSGDTE